ncbi:MAG: hypothetical protein PVG81_11135, partial [Desulfobacterales bacterium]
RYLFIILLQSIWYLHVRKKVSPLTHNYGDEFLLNIFTTETLGAQRKIIFSFAGALHPVWAVETAPNENQCLH